MTAAARPMPDASHAGLVDTLDRITSVVDAETSALRSHADFDLEASNRLKSQALLDLTRRLRTEHGAPADASVRAALDRLRASLVDNRNVVAMHIDAAGVISSVIIRALEREESDSTYAARPPRATRVQ